jgi:hypothetical protein
VPDRLLRTPASTCATIFGILVIGLALDQLVELPGQMVLGLLCWLLLAWLLKGATREERVQTLLVVAVATCFEIIGSVIWGVYVYRLDNLPMFVPPGHGMVYLFGLRFSQTAWARANGRLLVRAALVGVLGWAVLGLTVLPRMDVAGAIGAVVLAAFLLRGRAREVYAGVFLFVAFLEVYGVSLGTWYWVPEVPGLGVPNGNPPSGIAAGYVFFDIAALAMAPWALRGWERLSGRWAPGRGAIVADPLPDAALPSADQCAAPATSGGTPAAP